MKNIKNVNMFKPYTRTLTPVLLLLLLSAVPLTGAWYTNILEKEAWGFCRYVLSGKAYTCTPAQADASQTAAEAVRNDLVFPWVDITDAISEWDVKRGFIDLMVTVFVTNVTNSDGIPNTWHVVYDYDTRTSTYDIRASCAGELFEMIDIRYKYNAYAPDNTKTNYGDRYFNWSGYTYNAFRSGHFTIMRMAVPEALNGKYKVYIGQNIRYYYDGVYKSQYGRGVFYQPAIYVMSYSEVERSRLVIPHVGTVGSSADRYIRGFNSTYNTLSVPQRIRYLTKGTPITLTGAGTYRGSAVSGERYSWDMGDGVTYINQKEITHSYQNIGTYTVTLTVTWSGQEFKNNGSFHSYWDYLDLHDDTKTTPSKTLPPLPYEIQVVPSAAESTLYQSMPSPFIINKHGVTAIPYDLAKAAEVDLRIMSTRGQLIKALYTGNKHSGYWSEIWDGTDENGHQVPPGLYFVILKTAEGSFIKKMSILWDYDLSGGGL